MVRPVFIEANCVWPGMARKNWLMVGVAQLVEPRIVIPVVVGSNPIVHPKFLDSKINGPLAQLVEQWTLNPLVQGSSP
jgi:hypothetical protein